MNNVINHLLPYTTRAITDMTSGKTVAHVQSRATDFPAVINVGYCPRVRAITNTSFPTECNKVWLTDMV